MNPALIYRALMVSFLMAACISVDIIHHKGRRRNLWVAVGFLLGPVGVGIYLAYDRWIAKYRKGGM